MRVKITYLAGMALLTIVFSCKKSGMTSIHDSLIGKWIFTESKIGTGPPGQWQPVTPRGQTIEFKEDGSFISSGNFLTGTTHFRIMDSVTVKFSPETTSSGYILMYYSIDTLARDLILSPANPACIEGCQYKFIR